MHKSAVKTNCAKSDVSS